MSVTVSLVAWGDRNSRWEEFRVGIQECYQMPYLNRKFQDNMDVTRHVHLVYLHINHMYRPMRGRDFDHMMASSVSYFLSSYKTQAMQEYKLLTCRPNPCYIGCHFMDTTDSENIYGINDVWILNLELVEHNGSWTCKCDVIKVISMHHQVNQP